MRRGLKMLRMIVVNSVAGLYWMPRGLRNRLYRWCGIAVGNGTHIFPGQVIRPGRVRFGAGVFVNGRCTFEPGDAAIVIGDDVFLAPNVTITASTHEIGPSAKRAGEVVSRPVTIGRGTWVGAGAVILPGVSVAPGCVIAAGAVVTKDTEPDGLYGGVPASRLRTLMSDV